MRRWGSVEHRGFCVKTFEVSRLRRAAASAASSHFSLTWLKRWVELWLTGLERPRFSQSAEHHTETAEAMIFFFLPFIGEKTAFFFQKHHMILHSIVDSWLRGRGHYIPLVGAVEASYALRQICLHHQQQLLTAADLKMCLHFSLVWGFLLLDQLAGSSCEQAQCSPIAEGKQAHHQWLTSMQYLPWTFERSGVNQRTNIFSPFLLLDWKQYCVYKFNFVREKERENGNPLNKSYQSCRSSDTESRRAATMTVCRESGVFYFFIPEQPCVANYTALW